MERIIVVGIGFSGRTLAWKIAKKCNLSIKAIEKCSHIGKNMLDEYDKNGILTPCNFRLLSYIDGNYVQLLFNSRTM